MIVLPFRHSRPLLLGPRASGHPAEPGPQPRQQEGKRRRTGSPQQDELPYWSWDSLWPNNPPHKVRSGLHALCIHHHPHHVHYETSQQHGREQGSQYCREGLHDDVDNDGDGCASSGGCGGSDGDGCGGGRGHRHGDDELLLETLCEGGHLDRALDVLSRMDAAPSTAIYLSLLKTCIKRKALTQAERVQADLARRGARLTGLLGDYLVVALAKCGAIDEAHQIFCKLPHLTVISWTAMISACAESGCSQEAFRMYQCMQDTDVEPNSYTFVSLLKACGSALDLKQGMKLHADASSQGLVSHVFVSSTLVSMYGKCGAVVEAEDVFGELTERNIVSWNAMLSAYVEQGQGEKALLLYKQMQEEGVNPDQRTFVMALQACGTCAKMEKDLVVQRQSSNVIFLEIGRAIHANARTKGFASDVFVGTTLVSMYSKWGAILEAGNVLGALSQRNVVSWNVMLSAYVEQGQGKNALHLYRWMQQERVSPDQLTFVIVFQACGTLAQKEEDLATSLAIGQALHVDACKKGFVSDVFVGSTLMSMYSKCRAVVDAEGVFSALFHRNVVSWNVMLSAYVEHGQGEKALLLYRQMQEEGMNLDQHALMFALQACGILGGKEGTVTMEEKLTKLTSLEIGQALHAYACKKGLASDVFVGNTLVSMYGRCGAIMEAQHVFGALSQCDVVSWNAMISTFIQHDQGEKVLQLHRQMHQEGMCPDHLTFVMALQACITLAEKEAFFGKGRTTKVVCLEIGKALHADATRKDFVLDVFLCSALLSMYAKCGVVEEAEDAFSALIQRDTVSWNAMLSAYVEKGQGNKALGLYRQMHKQHATLDIVTFVCILQACSAMGSLEICQELHFDITCAGYDRILSIAAIIIHVYGSCASMVDAQTVFGAVPGPDIVSWNAYISGHAGDANLVANLGKFEDLKLAGFQPDELTFTSVLSACSHSGLMEGHEYFESMSRDYGVPPDLKHYGSIVDLLGRAGDFNRLENILERMPVQVDLTLWLCLLSACRKHGNLELAKHAYDHAVNLQPKQDTAYIIMSSIYVDAGLLEDAAEVDKLRKVHVMDEAWPELD